MPYSSLGPTYVIRAKRERFYFTPGSVSHDTSTFQDLTRIESNNEVHGLTLTTHVVSHQTDSQILTKLYKRIWLADHILHLAPKSITWSWAMSSRRGAPRCSSSRRYALPSFNFNHEIAERDKFKALQGPSSRRWSWKEHEASLF
jgi:hypothetical protein